MVTWNLKSCPRCGGDMYIGNDLSGWYEQCLQCSHRLELKRTVELKQPVSPGGTRSRVQLKGKKQKVGQS